MALKHVEAPHDVLCPNKFLNSLLAIAGSSYALGAMKFTSFSCRKGDSLLVGSQIHSTAGAARSVATGRGLSPRTQDTEAAAESDPGRRSQKIFCRDLKICNAIGHGSGHPLCAKWRYITSIHYFTRSLQFFCKKGEENKVVYLDIIAEPAPLGGSPIHHRLALLAPGAGLCPQAACRVAGLQKLPEQLLVELAVVVGLRVGLRWSQLAWI